MTLAPERQPCQPHLSANTQAILLLTSPLLTGASKGSDGAKVLSSSEYQKLTDHLRAVEHQPADLLNSSRDTVLASVPANLDPTRLNQLLSRGFQLSQAIEHWANRSITVISRADEAYPARYKQRFKQFPQFAPPLLYACGNFDLLNQPALAVVGSRSTPEALLQQTSEIGALAASAGVVIASGAARGVDEAAMISVLKAGGSAIGVMADSLEKMSARSIWRHGLTEGRLLLLSAEVPAARFQVWRAMARNKLIYALADAGLVMSSAKGAGGTWEGAKEQLTKLRSSPIYVIDDPRGGEGLTAIHEMGASQWPNPSSPEQLNELLASDPLATNQGLLTESTQALLVPQIEPVQQSLLELRNLGNELQSLSKNPKNANSLDQLPEVPKRSKISLDIPESKQQLDPAQRLLDLVNQLLLDALEDPKSEAELAELLKTSKSQTREWCKRLVSQGLVRKMTRPVRYVKT